jgi:hypothetical protein
VPGSGVCPAWMHTVSKRAVWRSFMAGESDVGPKANDSLLS